MTDKRWVRTLSGAKLAALVGQTALGALAAKEIARRDRHCAKASGGARRRTERMEEAT